MQLYVKVKMSGCAVHNEMTSKDKQMVLTRCAREALEPLKNHIQNRWPDLAYSPSNIYPSLVLMINNPAYNVADIANELRLLDFVELAETC